MKLLTGQIVWIHRLYPKNPFTNRKKIYKSNTEIYLREIGLYGANVS